MPQVGGVFKFPVRATLHLKNTITCLKACHKNLDYRTQRSVLSPDEKGLRVSCTRDLDQKNFVLVAKALARAGMGK